MSTVYEEAVARIDATPELEPYRETILYDWNEGDDHYLRVVTSTVDEIVGWAVTIERGTNEDINARRADGEVFDDAEERE